MAFSRSKLTLAKVREYLEPLARGEAQVWEVPEGQSSQFAYKLREGLFIAKLHKDEFPALAEAASRFTIEVVSPTRVQARRARQTTQATVLTVSDGGAAGSTVTHGLELASRPVQTSGPQNSFSIINAWTKRGPSSDPLHFPQADLSVEELTTLYHWASKRTPPLMIMLVEGTPALTLGLVDHEVYEYSWRPTEVLRQIEKDKAREKEETDPPFRINPKGIDVLPDES